MTYLYFCLFTSILIGRATLAWGNQDLSLKDENPKPSKQRIAHSEDAKNLGSWDHLKTANMLDLATFRSINLGQLKSENLIVIFWANWCDACKLHLIKIENFLKKINEEKFEVVAVNIDKLQSEAIAGLDFFKKNNINFRVLHLQEFSLIKKMNITKIPLDLLFDKRRNLVAFHVGLSESKYKQFTSAIEDFL